MLQVCPLCCGKSEKTVPPDPPKIGLPGLPPFQTYLPLFVWCSEGLVETVLIMLDYFDDWCDFFVEHLVLSSDWRNVPPQGYLAAVEAVSSS